MKEIWFRGFNSCSTTSHIAAKVENWRPSEVGVMKCNLNTGSTFFGLLSGEDESVANDFYLWSIFAFVYFMMKEASSWRFQSSLYAYGYPTLKTTLCHILPTWRGGLIPTELFRLEGPP